MDTTRERLDGTRRWLAWPFVVSVCVAISLPAHSQTATPGAGAPTGAAPAVAGVRAAMAAFIAAGLDASQGELSYTEMARELAVLLPDDIGAYGGRFADYCRQLGARALAALDEAQLRRDVITISVAAASMHAILAAAEELAAAVELISAGELPLDEEAREELARLLRQVLEAGNNVASVQGLQAQIESSDAAPVFGMSDATFAQPLPVLVRDRAASLYVP